MTDTFLHTLSHCHCKTFQSWSATFSSERGTTDIQSEVLRILENIERDASLQASTVTIEQVLEMSYPWARFLVQHRIAAYEDPIEQLGAHLALQSVPYEGGETVHALFGALHVIDQIEVTQRTHMRQRWSYFGQQGRVHYLSGPISLINHACHEHSNVVLKLVKYGGIRRPETARMVAVAERQIMPGDKIYATYDNDAELLFETRGIACNLCKQ